MSVKIRKAAENSLYSFEKFTTDVMGIWITEMKRNLKEQEKKLKEKMIKTCVSQFSKGYDIEEDDIDELHDTLRNACAKHKLGKLKVSCPNFVVNHHHTDKDIEATKKGGELEDYKKFLLEIKKKREPTERKPRQAVTTYQLWQSNERTRLKNEEGDLKPSEIRDKLKKSWAEFKENEKAYKALSEKAKGMKELPNKKKANNGLGRTAYHIFYNFEKESFKESNPEADSEEISEHISKAWKEVKANQAKYDEYIELAREKAENGDDDEDKKAKKKNNKKKENKKKNNKKKNNKKKKKADSDDESDDELLEKEDEVKVEDSDDEGIVEDENSEAELEVSDPEHSDSDSDIGDD